jgi:type III secretion protein J
MPQFQRLAVILLCLLLSACQVEIYGGLSQREANEMVAVLARADIEASREETEPGIFRVMVPDSDLARAVEALERVGLPAERFQSLGEIFPGDGLIVSPYEQRVRTMHALNQEIARSLTTITGVRNARVHIVLPDLDLRGQPINPPSAAILIHHAAGLDTEALATRVRMLVANAVQGMNFRDVSVSFFTSALGEAPAIAAAADTGGRTSLPSSPDTRAIPPVTEEAREARGFVHYLFWAIALLMVAGAAFLAWRERYASGMRAP